MGIINSRISSSQHITNKTWLSSVTQVLDLPATAGLVLAHGPHLWPSTGTDPSCAATESTLSTAFTRRRGPLRLTLRPMPTTVLAMEATAMEVLATDTARGLLTLRLMLTTAMVDTVLAMEATAMEVLATDTARGLLMLSLRPMPGMVDMDLASGASLLPA